MSPQPSRPRRRGGVYVAAVIAGALGVAIALAGAGLLWVDGEKDDRGYVSTHDNALSTPTRALVSENLDLDLVGVGPDVGADALGRLRLDVSSRDDKPLFVGVARTADVDGYVRGSAHAVVRDFDFAPFDADVEDRSGGPLDPPATSDIWVASGPGSLEWKVRDGDWSVVVMNADASPGVDAELDAGLSLPWLDDAGWGLLGAGVLVAAVGAVLLLAGGQRRPDEPNPSAPRSVPSSSATTVSSGAQ